MFCEDVQVWPSSLGLHEGYSKYMPLLPFTRHSVNNILENCSDKGGIVILDLVSNLNFFVQLCGHVLRLNLKTLNWKEQTEKEIELCTNNTIPLCENVKPISVTNGDELYSKLVLFSALLKCYFSSRHCIHCCETCLE